MLGGNDSAIYCSNPEDGIRVRQREHGDTTEQK